MEGTQGGGARGLFERESKDGETISTSIARMNISPVSPLIPLYIAQLLFGFLYAALIHWLSVNHYLPGSTAWSVVIGVSGTLFVQWVFIRECWSPLVTFGSFAGTGLPMTVTYLFRHQKRVLLSHRKRRLGNSAMHIRDDVVMDLASMTHEIAENNATVVSVVHRLHQDIGKLKAM